MAIISGGGITDRPVLGGCTYDFDCGVGKKCVNGLCLSDASSCIEGSTSTETSYPATGYIKYTYQKCVGGVMTSNGVDYVCDTDAGYGRDPAYSSVSCTYNNSCTGCIASCSCSSVGYSGSCSGTNYSTCYTSCSKACTPIACPSGYSCTYNSGYTYGTQYYGSSTCSAQASVCTIATQTCNTPCTSVANRSTSSGSESCTRSCSIANGTCSYSGSTQTYTNTCSSNYTGGGCSSAGASCSGCSSWTRTSTGTCSGGTISITCNAGYYLSNGTCVKCEAGYYCPGNNNRGQCTGATYSGAGAASCTTCPNPSTYASRSQGVSYWISDDIHDTVGGSAYMASGGCYASFSDTDSNATFTTLCYYNTTDGDYGKGNSYCQVYKPTWCAKDYYTTLADVTYGLAGVDALKGSACVHVGTGYYSADGSTTRTACTNKPANSYYTGSGGGSNACPWACNAGYYGSSANGDTSCAACGSGNFCTGGTHRASCATAVKSGSPTPSNITSLSSGSWSDYTHGASQWDCICDWYFSDDTRIQYLNQQACANGPGGNNYTHYEWCRTGYYASDPLNFNNWYNSCTACTNKPANSRYTSYSTPSTMYAVESNCPWSCNANYYKSGSSCAACSDVSFTDSGSDTETITGGSRTRSKTRTCYRTTSSAGSTSSSACSGSGNCGAWSYGDWVVTCSAGYYLSNGTCAKCEAGYYCPGNNSRGQCTGATYQDETGKTSCKSCPTATKYASMVSYYWYWSSDGVNDHLGGCRAEFNENDSNGNYALSCAYNSGDYGVTGSASGDYCMANPTTCIAGKYAPNGTGGVWTGTVELMKSTACVDVGTGYWSGADSLTRTACTNKPANSYYTGSGGGSNACGWACNANYYKSGSSCAACSDVSFTDTGTDTETITGGSRTRSKTRTCYRTTSDAGSTSSSACTGTASCGDWSYGAWNATCSTGYTQNANDDGCNCNTNCTAVSNTSSTQTCERSCSIDNGTCSYSGSTQTCNGKYTAGGCSSAGATCSGCSSWGECTGGTKSITCHAGYYLKDGKCVQCADGTYSSAGATSCTACTGLPSNAEWTGSATSNSCPWSCKAGYYGSSANGDTSCADCGSGNYCTGGTHRAACSTTVKSGSPTPSRILSLSSGSWSDYEHGASQWDCLCDWHLSDSTRVQYLNQTQCHNGPSGINYTYYWWCRTGYYAADPLESGDWYTSCKACTNKPANSYYTSYSTPSTMYAVESNCPWCCDAGYYQSGSSCASCTGVSYGDSGTDTETITGGSRTRSKSRTCYRSSSPACSTSSSACTGTSSCGDWSYGDWVVTCSAGYYLSNGACAKCEAGYYCPGDNSRGQCTGATYSGAGAASCSSCPTATQYASRVTGYEYWSADGVHDHLGGCRAVITENDDTGNYSLSCAYNSGDYGVTGSASDDYCMAEKVTSCKAGYYAPAGSVWNSTVETIKGTVCVDVGTGYWSGADSLTRTECPVGYSGSDGNRGENTDCYVSCSAKTITGGTTTAVNAKEHYNGSAYPACTYNVNCNAKYGASGDGTSDPACAVCEDGKYSAGGNNVCEDCSIPDNATATGNGSAQDNCPWLCDEGYNETTDGKCGAFCTAGVTHIHLGTGLKIPLYSVKRTTPSINVRHNGTVCYADLSVVTDGYSCYDTLHANYNGAEYYASDVGSCRRTTQGGHGGGSND